MESQTAQEELLEAQCQSESESFQEKRSDQCLSTSSRLRAPILGVVLASGCLACYLAARASRTIAPQAETSTLDVSDFFDLTGMATENCYKNKTFYVELSGTFKLPHAFQAKAASARACQQLCESTYRCEHFSFWLSGACLLTSYSAYPKAYDGSDKNGVISGPRICKDINNGPTLDLASAANVPPFRSKQGSGCSVTLHDKYELAWAAEGETFFDDWQFLNKSETRGAEWYLNKSEAFHQGVTYASKDGAILRVGDQVHPFKRRSAMLHTAEAWRPDIGFVVVMKYKHVPYGPGLWPSFWFVNSDYHWPNGGELDVLEYANDETAKVTFHTNQNCSMDIEKLRQCTRRMRDVTPDMILSCYTNYTSNDNGCMPPQVRKDGRWYSENPGAIALVWDASGISSFHIPEAQIPSDLENNAPTPNSWPDAWRMAYMPFDENSCVDIAKPQEIVLTIAMCGDWAGNTWWTCQECRQTGFVPNYCVPGHVTEPATDCCTIYMSNPSAEEPLKTQGFFDIDYVKVFTPDGMKLPRYSAGTYRNGGEHIQATL